MVQNQSQVPQEVPLKAVEVYTPVRQICADEPLRPNPYFCKSGGSLHMQRSALLSPQRGN